MTNYIPITTKRGSRRFQETMREQVIQGKMIGGPGWSNQKITDFFGSKQWYGIPCSAVAKDGDPLGRVVHDYGFYKRGSYSINAAHANTSVRYDSFRRRVQVLDGITWYIKADLKSGFRQFGTHPSD